MDREDERVEDDGAAQGGQEALREAIDHLDFVLGAFGAADYEFDLRTNRVRPSRRLNALYGFPPDHPTTLDEFRARYHPDDRAMMAAIVPEALTGARTFEREMRIVLPGGEIRCLLTRGEILLGPDGEPERVRGAAMDVTARRATEARLRESQDRLLALIEGIPQLVWRAEGEGLWTWSSPQWTALTGLSEAGSRGRGWLGAIHPDDRDRTLQAWAAAMASGRYEVDCRIRDAAGDRYRWFTNRASPLRDADGRIVEWLGTSTDIDDLRRLKEEEGLLLAELQHRVRNTLSVIRSIARRTARTTDTVDGYAMHLDGRIGAFARVQAAVTRDPAAGVDLAALVADELLAHAAHEGDGLRIAGPPVRLHPKPAETLGLAIHELATNAVKHGALSVPEGRIAVSWWLEDGHLCFEWRESGLPGPLPELTRRGFGTDLLERTLAYELKARVRREGGPEGLAWRIDLPVDARLIHGAAVA